MADERTEWISVDERLPEPLTEVLIIVQRHAWSNSGKTIQPADSWVQMGSLRRDKIWMDDDSTIGTSDERRASRLHHREWREVTHWMPLPKPPATEAKETK